MRRFTILGMMGLVVTIAFCLAALREANDYWAGGLLLATPFLFALALIGALCGGPEKRSVRLGFVVLGGGYFALVFLGLSDLNLRKLPTNMLLEWVHHRVVGPSDTFVLSVAPMISPNGPARALLVQGTLTGSVAPVPRPPPAAILPSPSYFVDLDLDGSLDVAQTGFWSTALPGAARYQAFQAVGHCLFSLVAGLLGVGLAKWTARSRTRGESHVLTEVVSVSP